MAMTRVGASFHAARRFLGWAAAVRGAVLSSGSAVLSLASALLAVGTAAVRSVAWSVRAAVFCVAACGGAATYDPVDHLHVGVDPRASADELVDHFERRGYQLVRRVDVNGLSAIELRESARRSVLRVLTRRGQQLSIDAPTEDLRRARVGIWPLPLTGAHADGTVLVVFAQDLARERTCLALLSLEPDGRLVETTARLETSDDACVEQLVVEGGRLRATFLVRYPALSVGP